MGGRSRPLVSLLDALEKHRSNKAGWRGSKTTNNFAARAKTLSKSNTLLLMVRPRSNGDATILLGNGDGTFHTGTIISTNGGTRDAIASGDLNNDGLSDVVVTNSSLVTALLNITNQNTVPPVAALNTSQPAGSESSNVYDFTVTYTDAAQMDASSFGNGNIEVIFPDGSVHAATLVSQNLGNAASVQVVYQIAFASNLTTADNGAYQVGVNANSVKDAAGLPVAFGYIGTLNLVVTPSTTPPGGGGTVTPPSGDFTVGAPYGPLLKTSVLTSSVQRGVQYAAVTNTSAKTLTGTVVVTLYTSGTDIHDSSSTAVATFTRIVKNLKPGKGFLAHFARRFTYPSTATTGFLVTDASLNGTLDSSDGALGITVNQAFVDADALAAAPTVAKAKLGRRIAAFFTVENLGNVLANTTATVSVVAIPQGGGTQIQLATAVPLKVVLGPAAKRRYLVSFLPATTPTASVPYQLILTINLPGDTNAADNTVTSVSTVTFS